MRKTDLFDYYASQQQPGPLGGIRVLALGGKGPVPHACTMLSDMGATVLRIERPVGNRSSGLEESPAVLRGQSVIELDLGKNEGIVVARDLARCADVVVEGFRAGVIEKLSLGPEVLCSDDSTLIYARMTGWGQSGPWCKMAGHDLNFLAVAGILDRIGPEGAAPTVPLNLIADYGAGSMFLVMGILAALVRRASDGKGDVIDVSMLDGLLALDHASWVNREDPWWSGPRGTNLLDGGAPFYTVYATLDSRYMAVAALEKSYFFRLLETMEIDTSWAEFQLDQTTWPKIREILSQKFLTRTMEQWAEVFRNVDACVTPILTMEETQQHEHVKARSALIELSGVLQHAPAPRFQAYQGEYNH